jgi:nucleolar complex protein 3
MQVSKDVQKLRDYESSLLKHYQTYLKHLLEASRAAGQQAAVKQRVQHTPTARSGVKAAVAHARVAVKCMAQLLTSLPHFNYA